MSIDDSFRVRNGLEVPTLDSIAVIDVTMPSVSPSLYLNFVNTPELDPRVSFTRTTTATYVDSTGLLKSAAAGEPRFDYNPVTRESKGLLIEEARTNLFRYTSGFEDAWLKNSVIITSGAIVAPDGTLSSSKIVETANYNQHLMYQSKEITSSVTYVYSIYAKAAEWTSFRLQLGSSGPIGVFDLSTGIATTESGATSASMVPAGNGWYRCSLVGVSNGSSTHYVYKTSALYTGDGVSGLHIWGAQLEEASFATSYIPSTNTFTSRASVGTYYDSTGTLQTAAINTARYQHNPSNLSVAPFLLLEEARTNSIRNSTIVGAVSGVPGTIPTNWQTTGISGISYDVAGVGTEKGINYIDIRVSGTSTVNSYAGITPDILIAGASGQTWTASYWMKLVSGSFTNTNANLEIRETDATQTFLANTLTALSLTPALTRYTQTRTLNNASTAFVSLRFVAQVSIGLAVDFTVRIGLPQLELGAYATSPILTSTTALTRSADVSSSTSSTRGSDLAQINTLTPWYNTTEGTLYAESSRYVTGAAGVQYIVCEFGVNANNNNEVIQLGSQYSTTNFQFLVNVNGVATAGLVESGVTANAKYAGAYKLNDFAYTKNGQTPVTDTLGTIPIVNQFNIGSRPAYNNTGYLNGYIKRISYFPRRLSNTELVALTT